jgi:hypothetical protein
MDHEAFSTISLKQLRRAKEASLNYASCHSNQDPHFAYFGRLRSVPRHDQMDGGWISTPFAALDTV